MSDHTIIPISNIFMSKPSEERNRFVPETTLGYGCSCVSDGEIEVIMIIKIMVMMIMMIVMIVIIIMVTVIVLIAVGSFQLKSAAEFIIISFMTSFRFLHKWACQ